MVTLVGLLAAYEGLILTPYEVANLAHDMERYDLGILGGKQDHYAATFGGFNYIEFTKDDVLVNPLRISQQTVNELQHNLVIVFTGITRESSEIIQDQSARVMDGLTESLEGLRTQKRLAVQMKSTLLKGDLSNFGNLLGKAWEQKKRLSPKISNTTIEETYELAMRSGAIGGKITGAGGGGWILFYCDPWRRREVADALRASGLTVREIAFSAEGLQTWRVPS
jgi:D-glycero-alpha-D-manno-heptose-7-phosphate kinase